MHCAPIPPGWPSTCSCDPAAHGCRHPGGEEPMAEVGVALLTFAPARTQDFVTLGRCAEDEGYAACYTTESLTDTLSIDLAILLGTSRIRVGSFVTISYLRHPVIAAQMATTASDL